MRMLKAAGLVAAGLVAGAGLVGLGGRTVAQAQELGDLNARFVIGKFEQARKEGGWNFRAFFLKDSRTGDCYLAQPQGSTLGLVLKTDDNACSDF